MRKHKRGNEAIALLMILGKYCVATVMTKEETYAEAN
jgi:hypothetical protein